MFNAENETNNIIQFIKEYYQKNNLTGAIIGISGGKDSAVVASLFVKALGTENIIGVTLPCHSKGKDKQDAKLLSDYYQFKLINFDLTKIFDDFKIELNSLGDFNEEICENADINLKPRLRMSSLYYLASLYTNITKKAYLVAGTSNKCELYVGYFTKGGDSVHDIAIIEDFTVEEVIQIGEYLKVPKELLYKTPDDGLSNKTDEEKLGVSYKSIAKYMEGSKEINEKESEIIQKLHEKNQHKFIIPTYKRKA